MNAAEIQQAGMQSTVGRDCRQGRATHHALTSSRRFSVGSLLWIFLPSPGCASLISLARALSFG